MPSYPSDVLAGDWRPRRQIPRLEAELGLVVEDAASGFCGAITALDHRGVSVEDRRGRVRIFPFTAAGFLVEGVPTTLTVPAVVPSAGATGTRRRTASGSFAVDGARARVALSSRIWVEGDHDAALLERVWGDDLRLEGVVVEPIRGLDDLPALVAQFAPGPGRRLGVLADHLVPGSKESRIVAQVRSPYLLVTGHPYVDVWQAVKPASLGIAAWPSVPRGQDWKDGVARALGAGEPRELWRRVLAGVNSYADIEVPLLRAVEELVDFVTAPDGST